MVNSFAKYNTMKMSNVKTVSQTASHPPESMVAENIERILVRMFTGLIMSARMKAANTAVTRIL